jgi:uncharacterized protein
MTPDYLTQEDKKTLLRLARQALEDALTGEELPSLNISNLSACLQEFGASFVTLTRRGELRGCIGALDANMPLVEDVRCHAVAAALKDYRFPPLTIDELPDIKIEISRLTPLQRLEYENAEDLLRLLRPFVDGVVICDGIRRATFLPQVWDKVPNVELFLSLLCQKMGGLGDLWRCQPLQVWLYQVEKFSE